MSNFQKPAINRIRLFGSIKVMVVCSLFVAMSIVLGKFLSIPIGDNIRIGFENLSLLLAGILFGPLIGMFTAVAADIVGCFLKGYEINPIITLGAACIGFFCRSDLCLCIQKASAAEYCCHCICCTYYRFYDSKIYRAVCLFTSSKTNACLENTDIPYNFHCRNDHNLRLA